MTIGYIVQDIIVLDLEGVLIPEIWVKIANTTNISALSLTTRDIQNYDELMRLRINTLEEHNITLPDILDIISTIKPLEGAVDFLDMLRVQGEVIILSDTFLEFFNPIRPLLNYPTILCNSLKVHPHTQKIMSHIMRIPDAKTNTVKALQSVHCRVLASGDSYNDVGMILTADFGVFFNPPESITQEYPNIPVCRDYTELLEILRNNANS